MNKKTEEVWRILVFWVVLITLIGSAVWVIVSMALAPAESDDPYTRVKSSYVLMLLQCVLGVVAMFLPSMLQRRFKVQIPSYMIVMYAVFLYCAIYLGEVRSFYRLIPNWDTILHTFSGAMLGALGFSLVTLLNNTDRVPLHLSPFFVALFAFCFAVTVGVVWEVYEFSADHILGTDMQKFGPGDGTAYVGHAALFDTMADLIVDSVGAFVMSLIGYVSLKFEKGWLKTFEVCTTVETSEKNENNS